MVIYEVLFYHEPSGQWTSAGLFRTESAACCWRSDHDYYCRIMPVYVRG